MSLLAIGLFRFFRILAGVLFLIVFQPVPPVGADSSTTPGRVFRAGAARSNITPPLGLSTAGSMRDWKGTKIHDELWVRCLVLDNGDTKIAFAVCDSCMIPREIYDKAKERVEQTTGIPKENILTASTHTHSAPAAACVFQSDPDPWYLDFLTQRIVDGIRRADANLAPARIGWGGEDEPSEVFNRRWWMKPGTVPPDPFGGKSDKVRMNPPAGSPNLIRPAGPIDPEVSVLAVQSSDGLPVALLANYSLHYVGATGGTVSADYFGVFAENVERFLGAEDRDPEFVGILTNGTSGDINNINFRMKSPPRKPFEQIRHVANVVARAAHRAVQKMEYHDWVPLNACIEEIELGVRKPNPDEIERAKKIVLAAEKPFMETVQEIYAKETLDLAEYPDTVPVLLQTLRIGDLGIVAIPCEVFAETGLAIKRQSPFGDTFTIELANGYNGYLPTPEQHELGGYETWRAKSSYLEVEASEKIFATVMELLRKL